MMIWSRLLLHSWTLALASGLLPTHEERVSVFLYLPATLPCAFPFVEALSDLTMIWVKVKDQREVIIYKLLYGEESPEEQDHRYKGRVELSREFSQGNLHLTIKNVTYEDEGTYYCRAANHKGHGDKKVTLAIDKLNAVEPTVTLVTVGGKRCMKCRGSGVYGDPEVQWITAQGEDLSSYGKPNITEKEDGWKVVESTLHYDILKNVQILCHIKEGRLKRSTRAVISDGTSSVIVENDF
ncbi:butyrophilin subfamily 1 member A1-like [Eleutherodactylus coqui]|uniref:butyrophilin subfamily 1 member A1-like n=1 Tax=Eleutherodactylus coqui TaxID=57060 RepID=UPI0034633792